MTEGLSKVRVVFGKSPPDVFDSCADFPTLTPSLRCPFPGWCVEIMVQLAGFLNLELEPLVLGEDGADYGTYNSVSGRPALRASEASDSWDGMLGMVANGSADTVCAFYQRTQIRTRAFSFSYPVTTVRPVYVVQKNPELLSSGLWNAFSPYEKTTWVMYVAVFVLQAVFMVFVSKVEKQICDRGEHGVMETVWKLVRLQLYQPFRVDFFTMAGNCMILFFSMVQCRLFLDMYQNLLLSSLLRPVDKSQFSNAADILDQVSEGRYSFVTNYIGHWYFEELLASNSSTTHLEKLRNITLQDKVRTVRSVAEALDLVAQGDFIFPIQTDALASLLARDRCDLAYVSEGLPEKTAHLVFAKGSPLRAAFDRALLQNQDFVRRTYQKYFVEDFLIPVGRKRRRRRSCAPDQSEGKMKALNLMSIFGVVVVAAAGALLASAAFLAEFCLAWQHRVLGFKKSERGALLHLVSTLCVPIQRRDGREELIATYG